MSDVIDGDRKWVGDIQDLAEWCRQDSTTTTRTVDELTEDAGWALATARKVLAAVRRSRDLDNANGLDMDVAIEVSALAASLTDDIEYLSSVLNDAMDAIGSADRAAEMATADGIYPAIETSISALLTY